MSWNFHDRGNRFMTLILDMNPQSFSHDYAYVGKDREDSSFYSKLIATRTDLSRLALCVRVFVSAYVYIVCLFSFAILIKMLLIYVCLLVWVRAGCDVYVCVCVCVCVCACTCKG